MYAVGGAVEKGRKNILTLPKIEKVKYIYEFTHLYYEASIQRHSKG